MKSGTKILMRNGWRWIAALCLPLLAASAPTSALAYCQATTVQADTRCPSACSVAGLKVFWGTPEIEYAYHAGGFPGLDEAAARAAVDAAFSSWANAPCGMRPLGFRLTPLPLSTTLTVGPIETEPNLNVISVLGPSEWANLGFGASEFARTKLWFDDRTGEIVGADIAINAAIMPLATCTNSTACAAGAVDLQNVVTHEVGHFLGLGHSADKTATMWCGADRGDHEKRSLESDDVAGLCAVYRDGAAFIDQPSRMTNDEKGGEKKASTGGGCAVTGAETAFESWWWIALLFALLIPRRSSAQDSVMRRLRDDRVR